MWGENSINSTGTWYLAIYDSLKGQSTRYTLKQIELEILGTLPGCVRPVPSNEPHPAPSIFSATVRQFIAISVISFISVVIAVLVLVQVVRMRTQTDADVAGNAVWNELQEESELKNANDEPAEDEEDEDSDTEPRYYTKNKQASTL